MTKKYINKLNKKFDHVYIVLRYDSFIIDNPRQAITVLKVFVNESDAIEEAERLNQLARMRSPASKSESQYYVELGRIKKGILDRVVVQPVSSDLKLPDSNTDFGEKTNSKPLDKSGRGE